MIFDSHIHITKEEDAENFAKLIKNRELGILANATTTSEYDNLKHIAGARISFGIHPWNAEEFFADKSSIGAEGGIIEKITVLKPYFERAHAVGEVGMDSVWCRCDLNLQRELFLVQLEMAEELGKPVVLHTKGQERQIAAILKDFSIRKLVHWYSCEEYLEDYIAQDCYFTVGPNFAISPSVKAVIRRVPIERLLVETDGISAVQWAINRKIAPSQLPSVLNEAVRAIATVKGVTVDNAEKKLEENFYRFIGEFNCVK